MAPRQKDLLDSTEIAVGSATSGSKRWARRVVKSREEFSLQALIELVEDVVGIPDLYKVAELSLMNLMGVVGSPQAAIWAISEDHEAIRLRHFGFSESALALLEDRALPVLRDDIDPEGAIPIVVSETGDALGKELQEALTNERVEVISLFKVQDRPTTMLAIGLPYRGIYESFQLKSLETALCYVSAAMDNTRLQAQLTENNRRLRFMSERVRELDRLKREFLDNLTHELRTPLSVIIGCLDLALDFGELPPESFESLQTASKAAQTLDQMVLRLLEFRQAQAEQLELDCQQTSLWKFARNYHESRAPGISGDLREFLVMRASDDAIVNVDRRRLGQALDALIDNAVKFTPRGTQIQLTVQRTRYRGEEFAALRVSDDGPGIPQGMLEKIFESFRQLDGSLSRPVGGLGMGLPFAREIVKAMGGNIQVESTRGVGTSCLLLLPPA